MDVTSVACSGMRAAMTRQESTAHNLANLNTDEFHSLHTVQSEAPDGGVETETVRAKKKGVILPNERAEQMRAEQELAFSAEIYRTQTEMSGALIDVFG